jgi:hypothetical protein
MALDEITDSLEYNQLDIIKRVRNIILYKWDILYLFNRII